MDREMFESNLPEFLVFLLQEQETEGDTFDFLIELSNPVLYGALKRFYYLEGYEKEDLVQEGRIVLARVIMEYDLESPLSFLEYYQLMLMNHLNKLLRKQEAQSRRANKFAHSLDEITENVGIHIQGTSSAETYPEEFAVLKEAYNSYLLDLSGFEREVYDEFMTGKTVEEIAKSLECDVKQTKSALYRCRRKLDNYLQ